MAQLQGSKQLQKNLFQFCRLMVLAVVVCSSPTTEAGPLAHATIEGDNTLQRRGCREDQ